MGSTFSRQRGDHEQNAENTSESENDTQLNR